MARARHSGLHLSGCATIRYVNDDFRPVAGCLFLGGWRAAAHLAESIGLLVWHEGVAYAPFRDRRYACAPDVGV